MADFGRGRLIVFPPGQPPKAFDEVRMSEGWVTHAMLSIFRDPRYVHNHFTWNFFMWDHHPPPFAPSILLYAHRNLFVAPPPQQGTQGTHAEVLAGMERTLCPDVSCPEVRILF